MQKLKRNKIQELMTKALQGVAPMKHDNNAENALIVAYLNGNDDAGMALVECYLDFFSAILNRPTEVPHKSPAMAKLWADPTYQDYEDLFQEALLHFFIMVKEYDSTKAPFASFIGSTLKQRVFNRFFSEFLKIKSMEEYEFMEDIELQSETSIILDDDEENVPSEYLELYEAMNRLSQRQREVVEMSVVRGWDSTMIGHELGLSGNTVRVHLKKALARLRDILIPEEEKTA